METETFLDYLIVHEPINEVDSRIQGVRNNWSL